VQRSLPASFRLRPEHQNRGVDEQRSSGRSVDDFLLHLAHSETGRFNVKISSRSSSAASWSV